MYFFSSSLELSVSWYIHNSISLHIYYQEPVPRYNVTLPPSIADVSKRKWVGGVHNPKSSKANRVNYSLPIIRSHPPSPLEMVWTKNYSMPSRSKGGGGRCRSESKSYQGGTYDLEIPLFLSHPCFELSLLTSYLRFWAAYAFSYQYFDLAIPMLLAIYAFELPTLLRRLCFELLCLWPTYVFRLLCWQATHAFGLPMLLDYLCTQASYVF